MTVDLNTIVFVSITIDLLGVIISLAIFLFLVLEPTRKSKLNRLFRFFILCNIGLLLSDATAWLATTSTVRYAVLANQIANYLHFLFGPLTIAALSLYMYAYIDEKRCMPNKLKYTVLSISGLSMVLSTISQFNNMYYYFDENNLYHRGDWIMLHKGLMISVLLINVAIIIFYRKELKRRSAFLFMAYTTLPAITLFIQALFYGLSISNITSTLILLLIYIGVQIDKNTELTQNIAINNNRIALQGNHYRTLQSHIDETKKARHDLKHHLTVIQSFVETGEKEKLTDYVSQYKSLLLDDTIIFCDNFAINSLLWYYSGIAKKEGVNFDTKVELSENPGISDTDLCIIFGNLIENAIEACRKVDGERFIKINTRLTGNLLVIAIDNSFNGEFKNDDDKFISTKHEGLGIGTISVKAVAQKYDGTVEYSVKDEEFQVSIMLRIP